MELPQTNHPEKILIVEDEVIIAEDIRQAISEFGYTDCEIALDPEEFETQLRNNPPNLVLMDINLGEGDEGIELATKLNQETEIPVIFLTSYTDEETIRRAKIANPFGYLSKPVDEESLKSTMAIVLQKAYYEHKMRKKEVELRQSVDNLTRANQRLADFAYITTHDLKSPVVNIKALLSLLENYDMNDDVSGIVHKVDQSADTLEDLISTLSGLLDMTKMGENLYEKVMFDKLIEVIESNNSERFRSGEAKLTTDIETVPYVKGNLAYIRSIFLNIVSNSIKYKKPDVPAEIHIRTYDDHNNVIIEFKDNGIGIDLDFHGIKIFKLFQRANIDQEGKGIGLYLVKSQVEEMNGKIEIDSKLDHGTSIRIFLPKMP